MATGAKDANPRMQEARDPKIAAQEEFDQAREQGTAKAVEMFIQRHPDSALAERAKEYLRKLRSK